MMNTTVFFDIGYLLCCILIIVGLRKLSHPASSQKGNRFVSLSLILGILIAIFYPLEDATNHYSLIVVSVLIGAVIGMFLAKRVAITAMPEMVSALNGFGGGAAFIVSIVWMTQGLSSSLMVTVLLLMTLFVGGLTFVGSFIAYAKLAGYIKRQISFPFNRLALNIFFLLLFVFLASGTIYYTDFYPDTLGTTLFISFIVLSLLYGYIIVMPIGGADMPVVISLLNSLTGLTTAISGLMANDKFMFLGGVLVGSSGIILTLLMCKAMNRSFYKVVFSSFGNIKGAGTDEGEKNIKETTASELAILLSYAQKVAVVPGYGLAVAQAQKLCKELELLLKEKQVEVKYAIHPVAGRMPGHMNVLLAEADVSYDSLLDLEEANSYLKDIDVALVLGANDVVNTSAIESKDSPIYGMPILELANAKQNIIVKRTMNTGYAGIDNPLFYKPNSKMLFGDIKDVLQKTLEEIKLN